MKKLTKAPQKLRLDVSTIRDLQLPELREVVGGLGGDSDTGQTYSCRPTRSTSC